MHPPILHNLNLIKNLQVQDVKCVYVLRVSSYINGQGIALRIIFGIVLDLMPSHWKILQKCTLDLKWNNLEDVCNFYTLVVLLQLDSYHSWWTQNLYEDIYENDETSIFMWFLIANIGCTSWSSISPQLQNKVHNSHHMPPFGSHTITNPIGIQYKI
jgi:hypothetical protein